MCGSELLNQDQACVVRCDCSMKLFLSVRGNNWGRWLIYRRAWSHEAEHEVEYLMCELVALSRINSAGTWVPVRG